jgi:cell division transport system ATP-binding protein
MRFRSGVEALRDISVRIQEGEFVSLSGRSGAGKTTLLKLLVGELRPTEGQLVVAGRNLSVIKPGQIPWLRRVIGRLWQDVRLLPDRSVSENVALPLEIFGVDRAQIRRRVGQVLETMGMERHAEARPSWLSGLEQQRVAIARAIIHEPSILLADEPTGNLDPEGAREIVQILRSLHRRGMTIVLASHDVNLTSELGARIVLLNKGFLIEDDATGAEGTAP